MSVEESLLSVVRFNGTTMIAGIVECRAALELEKRGLVKIISGEITPDGGSGVIAKIEGTTGEDA